MNENKMNEFFVDFFEYGKRFLRTGTTDYLPLEYSEEFMRYGVESRSSMLFLGSDGLDFKYSDFNNKIGNISVALLRLGRDFGGLKKPYLFAQIQSRREDELDNGAGKMHRNFNQIRFTLLTEQDVFRVSREGQSLYASFLMTGLNKKSNYELPQLYLNDYEGQGEIAPKGKQKISLLASHEVIQKYFPQYIEEYISDLSNLVNQMLTLCKDNPSFIVDRSFSVSISSRLNLSLPEMMMYKVQLAQDLQMYVGWYLDTVLTFSLDDISNRETQLKFYGAPTVILSEKYFFDLMQNLPAPGDLRNVFDYLYSPDMPKYRDQNSPDISLDLCKVCEVKDLKFPDAKRLTYIEEHFRSLLTEHSDPDTKYLLFGALDNLWDAEIRSRWIRDNKHKISGSVLPLMIYLESRDQVYDFLINFMDLSDVQRTPKVKKLFNTFVNKHNWDELFAFRTSLIDFDLQKLYDEKILYEVKEINGFSQVDYLIDVLLTPSCADSTKSYFDKIVLNMDFQDFILKSPKWTSSQGLLISSIIKRDICSGFLNREKLRFFIGRLNTPKDVKKSVEISAGFEEISFQFNLAQKMNIDSNRLC